MASTEGLVPITRAFLASYYDKHPFTPLSAHVSTLSSQIRSMANDFLTQHPPIQGESILINEADQQPPHKMDENMWKNREYIEETIFLLQSSNWPEALKQQSTADSVEFAITLGKLKDKLHITLKALESFQTKNAEHVFNTVMTYLPQDFRGTLIRQQRERSERNKQAEVDTLVNSGGSIHDRYALLWKQQMDRRRQLAQLGSATGVYKTLVKYLVGVPQVLLDFTRQINDDDGPMEEQRHRYGPPLYSLTSMILSIQLFLSLSWARYDANNLKMEQITVLEQAVDVYTMELERFLTFISEVFANAPFFISAEVAGALEARKNDDYKEINVPAGKTYELMLPYGRYESDQGNFCTLMAGSYKLIWDNTYSTFFKKVLRYKIDCIPPVTESVQSD
uniref:GOLD domain-containing protein n=1 Tax=Glycine max TaxID=3847 RepID=I1MQR2_SOYBN